MFTDEELSWIKVFTVRLEPAGRWGLSSSSSFHQISSYLSYFNTNYQFKLNKNGIMFSSSLITDVIINASALVVRMRGLWVM